MKNCICILTIKPSVIWMEFLNTFTTYDVYMMCDDNSVSYQAKYGELYPKIKFLQVTNSVAYNLGFKNLSSAISPQQIVNSWDKAVYYFSFDDTTYDNVWFIEDDVYFYNEKTLFAIDAKFTISDLLTNVVTPKSTDMKSAWHWHWNLISIGIKEPHFRAMVCATRVSRKLLLVIGEYAREYGTLFYLEAFFPTMAFYGGLKHDIPDELHCVEYRRDWNSSEINCKNLYHPLKNLAEHVDNRQLERFN